MAQTSYHQSLAQHLNPSVDLIPAAVLDVPRLYMSSREESYSSRPWHYPAPQAPYSFGGSTSSQMSYSGPYPSHTTPAVARPTLPPIDLNTYGVPSRPSAPPEYTGRSFYENDSSPAFSVAVGPGEGSASQSWPSESNKETEAMPTTKPKYKRKLTERRKEQNRAAQVAFRARKEAAERAREEQLTRVTEERDMLRVQNDELRSELSRMRALYPAYQRGEHQGHPHPSEVANRSSEFLPLQAHPRSAASTFPPPVHGQSHHAPPVSYPGQTTPTYPFGSTSHSQSNSPTVPSHAPSYSSYGGGSTSGGRPTPPLSEVERGAYREGTAVPSYSGNASRSTENGAPASQGIMYGSEGSSTQSQGQDPLLWRR